jgi:hypothetical protein
MFSANTLSDLYLQKCKFLPPPFYFVTQSRLVVTDVSGQRIWSRFMQSKKVTIISSWSLEPGPICYPETSVTNYQSTLHNIREERRSHLHRDVSIRSINLFLLLLSLSFCHRQLKVQNFILFLYFAIKRDLTVTLVSFVIRTKRLSASFPDLTF